MKVCIIGAGTAGLCSARRVLEHDMEPTVFEQTDQIGGTWVYTDEVGHDKYGIPIHSSMYQGLRTNLPKEVMGYPDFHIKNHKNSYISSSGVLEFLNQYAAHYKLKKYIKFLHYVIQVHPYEKQWQVLVKDLIQDKVNVYIFDKILICNGHYNTPINPTFAGLEIFKGIQLHSHDYKNPAHYSGESVLVVGAGPSGMDICNEVSKYAARVTLSHHLPEKPKTKFLSNVTQKPDILRFSENGAFFADGSYDAFTVIIFCTGFKYAFPFLSTDCGVYVDENFVQPLYKHCINIQHPSMAFIGLPFYVCAAQMMDLQARFVLKFYKGEKSLPSKEEMLRDTNQEMAWRWSKGYKKRHAHMMGPNQMNYYDDLAKTAGIESIPPVMTKLHNKSSERFLDDLLNFRDDVFRIIDEDSFEQI